jgi:putative ABC transport system substrate-binding protein
LGRKRLEEILKKTTPLIFVTAPAVLLLVFALFLIKASAQSSGAVVAVLMPNAGQEPVLDGLREGLGKLGYKDGTNIRFIVDQQKGNSLDYAARAAKLVAGKPDVLFAVTTHAAMAAQHATATIPIVFVSVGAPVEAGLIGSFASSGNNLTGVSSRAVFLSGKRLELLSEIAPNAKKILLLVSAKEIIGRLSARHSEETGRRMGLQLVRRDLTSRREIEDLLQQRWAGVANAVFLLPGSLTGAYVGKIIDKCKEQRLPLMVYEETLVARGALASYGSERHMTGLQGAELVAKILHGARPEDIPIETPKRLILTLNLRTANDIGLRIPRRVLQRANRFIY